MTAYYTKQGDISGMFNIAGENIFDTKKTPPPIAPKPKTRSSEEYFLATLEEVEKSKDNVSIAFKKLKQAISISEKNGIFNKKTLESIENILDKTGLAEKSFINPDANKNNNIAGLPKNIKEYVRFKGRNI